MKPAGRNQRCRQCKLRADKTVPAPKVVTPEPASPAVTRSVRRAGAAVLVIGVGNLCRGDDGAGIVVARKLRVLRPANMVIREESGEGASLMEAWGDARDVFIVDAVQSGGRAGAIHRLDAGRRIVPSRFFRCSTHAFSVAEAIELARALGRLPPRIVFFGIVGKNFQTGADLSPEVENAAQKVARRIRRESAVRRPPGRISWTKPCFARAKNSA